MAQFRGGLRKVFWSRSIHGAASKGEEEGACGAAVHLGTITHRFLSPRRNPRPQSSIFIAAIDEAYEIIEIRLDSSGDLTQKSCADCSGKERTFITLETGQSFEVRDWKTAHSYLEMR